MGVKRSKGVADRTQADTDFPGPAMAGVQPVQRRVCAGALLFHRNDPAQGIYRLVTGRIRLERVTVDGTPVAVHAVRPGELFAEASLFSDCYHCDARALQDSELYLYAKRDLVWRFRDHPAALWEFAAGLSRRVQDLRTRLEIRQLRGASDRLVTFLRLNADTAGRYHPDGTWKELAEELGLTHEALYRALARLQAAGLVDRTRGGIRLR